VWIQKQNETKRIKGTKEVEKETTQKPSFQKPVNTGGGV